MHMHDESLWTVFWGQLGPEKVRENWLTAVLHSGIFLPPAQYQNKTDRDSDKCTRRTENSARVC